MAARAHSAFPSCRWRKCAAQKQPMNAGLRTLFYLQAEMVLLETKWINKQLFRGSELIEKPADLNQMKAEEVANLLQSNMGRGLGSIEVEKRLKQYGYNEVPEKKTNPAFSFAKKF
jgi:magnesium-transporting ATPase (P-type)